MTKDARKLWDIIKDDVLIKHRTLVEIARKFPELKCEVAASLQKQEPATHYHEWDNGPAVTDNPKFGQTIDEALKDLESEIKLIDSARKNSKKPRWPDRRLFYCHFP